MARLIPSHARLDAPAVLASSCERACYIETGQRFELLEACKGLAACIIVGHHFCEYSPHSDVADQFAPSLMYGIYNYGLFVVHMFFVFGGFAIAIAMPDHPISWKKSVWTFVLRYLRLAPPYFAMLLCLVGASWSMLSQGMNPPLIDSFSWWQLLAHVFFLQDVFGYGNLSAGTWYICIDLQYACLFLLVQSTLHTLEKSFRRGIFGPTAMSVILFPLGIVATWYWSRELAYDVYVFYFLGSLIFGTLVGWTLQGRIPLWVFLLYAFAMTTSLFVEFRPRILVALGSGLIIYAVVRFFPKSSVPIPLLWLGKVSYSLFLIHYLVNGLVLHQMNSWVGSSPSRAFASMIVAFMASLLAAAVLYYFVEAPCHRWVQSIRKRTDIKLSSPVSLWFNH